jgi:hypothetical protein
MDDPKMDEPSSPIQAVILNEVKDPRISLLFVLFCGQ